MHTFARGTNGDVYREEEKKEECDSVFLCVCKRVCAFDGGAGEDSYLGHGPEEDVRVQLDALMKVHFTVKLHALQHDVADRQIRNRFNVLARFVKQLH